MLKQSPLPAGWHTGATMARTNGPVAGTARRDNLDPRAEPMLVNLGCGRRIDRRWVNFDLFPESEGVTRANFLRGIPLRDGEADVVYHSHVLEHLTPAGARDFLGECRRILRPNGILRVVVPDLEQTVLEYIATINGRRSGTRSEADHQWMLVELIDQLARASSGGAFAQFVKQRRGNDRFVLGRLGLDGSAMLDAVRAEGASGLRARLMRRVLGILPSPWGEALSETYFRTRGEVHKWMYDELSLGDLLAEAGFSEIVRVAPSVSAIPDWASYRLDVGDQLEPWKPLSLYMEARPGS